MYHIKIIGFLTFSLLVMSNSANAEVYKWTDENGKVHYSDKPFDKDDAKLVELKYSEANEKNATENRARTESYRDKAREFKDANSSSSQKKYSSHNESDKQAARDKKNCEEYKARLAKYKEEGVIGVNPITGQKGEMSGSAKQQAMENAQAGIDMYCS